MEIQANSSPVTFENLSPLTPNYWGDLIARATMNYKDNVFGVGQIKLPGQAYTCTKAVMYKDLTTNPKVVMLEDPISPTSLGYTSAGFGNEFGVYGGYQYPNPENPKQLFTARCHWDWNGKLLSKNHSYVLVTEAGQIDQTWLNANFTAPAGWKVNGFQPIKNFVFARLNALMEDGSMDNSRWGFVVLDPTGVAPDRMLLPSGMWKTFSISSISNDGRYVSFRTSGLGLDGRWIEGDFAHDFENPDKIFNLKKVLGLDPWTAYKVYDSDLNDDNSLILQSKDAVKDGSGTTTGMIDRIQKVEGWQDYTGDGLVTL
jgi:hypothetical protein